MSQKQDNIKYFIGGSAVGMAAGLFIGKLLIPAISSQRISNIDVNMNERSQDDNIFNSQYSHKKEHCYPRSKSTSRYEDKVTHGVSVPIIPFKEVLMTAKNRIDKLTVGQKPSARSNTISQSIQNQLSDMGNKNNVSYSLCNRDDSNINNRYFNRKQENGENCNCEVTKPENLNNLAERTILFTKQSNSEGYNINLPNLASSTSPKKVNIGNINVSDQKNVMQLSKISKCMDLPIVFKNLAENVNVDGSSIMNNVQKIPKSTINSHIFGTDWKNVTNSATCNTILKHEDEREDDASHFTTIDEFQESDLVSSTKRDNTDDV